MARSQPRLVLLCFWPIMEKDREVHEGGETYLRYMGRRNTSTIFRAIK